MLEDDPLDIKPCTHMGAYAEFADRGIVEVVAASDIDPERLLAFRKRFGTTSVYLDFREMLDEERPEIVSVCAYATERFEMVMASIEAGVKGIWCEKAFATNIDEGRRMIEACKASGTTLIVSHMRRWSEDYKKAKWIIENNGIGRLQSIVSHFSGSLIHTGTHAFDVLSWFGGDVEWVEGWLEGGRGELPWETAEDLGGHAVIQFKNGAYATVHAEAKGYFFFEFDIIGSHGRIRIGNNDLLEYYTPKDSLHYTGLKELYQDPFPAFANKNIWTEALGNLIECMEGGKTNMNGPEEGLISLEIALAIHESARTGKKVSLPLEGNNMKVRSR